MLELLFVLYKISSLFFKRKTCSKVKQSLEPKESSKRETKNFYRLKEKLEKSSKESEKGHI